MGMSTRERARIAALTRWSRIGSEERRAIAWVAVKGRMERVRQRVVAEAAERGETLTPIDELLRFNAAWAAEMARMRASRRVERRKAVRP